MVGIGGASGGGDADQGDDAGGTIEQRVHGIRNNAEAPEFPTDGELEAGEKGVAAEGGEENAADSIRASGFTHGRRSAAPPARGAR